MPLQDLDRYAQDAVLRDGRTVHLRPIRSDDLDAMMEMWSRLSERSIRLRFFAPRKMDRAQMRHFTDVDYHDRFALVATRGERITGVARLDRLPEDDHAAEFAVLVEDAEQGRGIGTALLRALFEPAQHLEISHFKGSFLPENRRLRHVLSEAGFEPAFTNAYGAVETSFKAVPSERFLHSTDEQDRKAAVEALRSVLAPSSIAVVGASRDPKSIGGLLLTNLRDHYRGTLYAVNPAAADVQGVASYPTIGDCPEVPDVVTVCVPGDEVADIVSQAGEAGTTAAVIVSSGFGEAGAPGRERQRRLQEVASASGIRIVGPNCMGMLNAADDIRMNSTFSTIFPRAGNAAFLSQSGALGLAILSAAHRSDLGLSSFISVGDKLDISGNDLLQYWESDDDTGVVLLYLESFGNPQKFGRIARRVGRSKPIVAVKAGRSSSGVRISSTGVAPNDDAVDALFAQAGVIRTRTLAELFDVAAVLSSQPLPQGHRVGILTNGGGPGLLAADACESVGLEVCELREDTQERLRELLPAAARVGNPVDVIASTSAETYGQALRVLADDGNLDMVVAIFVPPIATSPEDVAEEIAAARDDISDDIPVITVFMAGDERPDALVRNGIPSFVFPEDAAQALGHVARYASWRRRPLGHVVEVTDADGDAARAVVDEALTDTDERWLDDDLTGRLLDAFGIALDGGDGDDARDDEHHVKLVAGVRHDPTFGQVMMVGMGGELMELIGDVRVRLHPVTDHDVDDMLAELRGFPVLSGNHGAEPLDIEGVRMLLFRLSALVEAVDEIQTLDLQPVVVGRRAVTVAGARVLLRRAPQPATATTTD
jgi:acyl-CoA synthetase (NDP forming)/RimJ/RimL family protein N-acetyltransferase